MYSGFEQLGVPCAALPLIVNLESRRYHPGHAVSWSEGGDVSMKGAWGCGGELREGRGSIQLLLSHEGGR